MPEQDAINEFIGALIQKGYDADAIKAELEWKYKLDAKTADERIAQYLSQSAIAENGQNTPERKKRIRATGLTDMVIGGVICAVAVSIFLWTLAERRPTALVVIWGPLVVFGMYKFIDGLWSFIRGRYSSD